MKYICRLLLFSLAFFISSCVFDRGAELLDEINLEETSVSNDSVLIQLQIGKRVQISRSAEKTTRASDSDISNMTLYVFKDDGTIEYKQNFTGAEILNDCRRRLLLSKGKKMIIAVANVDIYNTSNQLISSLSNSAVTLSMLLNSYFNVPQTGYQPPLPMFGFLLKDFQSTDYLSLPLEQCLVKYSVMGSFINQFQTNNNLTVNRVFVKPQNIPLKCRLTNISSVNFTTMSIERITSNFNADKSTFSTLGSGQEIAVNVNGNSFSQDFFLPAFMPVVDGGGNVDAQKSIPWLAIGVQVTPRTVYNQSGGTSTPSSPIAILSAYFQDYIKTSDSKPKFYTDVTAANKDGESLEYPNGILYYRYNLCSESSSSQLIKYTLKNNYYYKIDIQQIGAFSVIPPAQSYENMLNGWSLPDGVKILIWPTDVYNYTSNYNVFYNY